MPASIDLEQFLAAALAQHEARQFDLAEAGYRTVLQHDPDEPDALNLLGLLLQERGAFEESIALLTRALSIVPDFPEALANLARAQLGTGALAAAADAARRAIALDPRLAEAHLQLGQALLGLGDHVGAAATLRHATILAPQSAEALRLLSIALMRSEDHAAVADCLTALLALDPNLPDTKADLALALTEVARGHRAAGDAAAAAAAAKRAVALNETLPDAQFELGLALLMQQENAGAIDALRRVTELVPATPEAWAALAAALTADGEGQAAAEAWQKALALRPDNPDLLMDMAKSLADLGRSREALPLFRQAQALAPDNRRAQYGVAWCLWDSGEVPAAAGLCREVLETSPDLPAFWMLLGDCETVLGHFDAATECYRRAKALDPGVAGLLHAPIVPGAAFEGESQPEASWDVLTDSTRRLVERATAGFALTHASDRNGEYDQAFEACALANRLLREDRAARGIVFDRPAFRDMVDRLITTIGPATFQAMAGWGDPSDLPVFVVGMPRSGTTLVEQIAASHRRVYGAGERRDIADMIATLDESHATDGQSEWDRASVRRESIAHLQRLRDLDGQASRIIDKMPNNILHLGKIALLFPGARIVVCRRDLRDTCLSCFFQYFHGDGLMWTNDLGDCGFWAREVERLMDHWRKVLPVPVLEIQYETLVTSLESESRRLIDFLGLDWDPACLAFHETERAVWTASQWQVRQPIYASSVGRWRHYRHHLGPLLQELEGLLPPDSEDAVPPPDAVR